VRKVTFHLKMQHDISSCNELILSGLPVINYTYRVKLDLWLRCVCLCIVYYCKICQQLQ